MIITSKFSDRVSWNSWEQSCIKFVGPRMFCLPRSSGGYGWRMNIIGPNEFKVEIDDEEIACFILLRS